MDYGDVIYRQAPLLPPLLNPWMLFIILGLGFITGYTYRTHPRIQYRKAGCSERRDRHMYSFMYKALIGQPASYINSMLDRCSGLYQTVCAVLGLKDLL